MWVFGYGSLLWKVDFKYELQVLGYIKGYVRRFYQHSVDHRGVPEKPGRVVTLIPSDNPVSEVWGVAYKIRTEDINEVTEHLDFREKNGYSKKIVKFFPSDASIEPFELTLYVATEDNESFAGPAPIEEIAAQIVTCQGPSGPNKEYVYNLAAAMRQLVPHVKDEHLFELEAAVRRVDPDLKEAVHEAYHKIVSVIRPWKMDPKPLWWSTSLEELRRDVVRKRRRIKCAAPCRREFVVNKYLKTKQEFVEKVVKAHT